MDNQNSKAGGSKEAKKNFFDNVSFWVDHHRPQAWLLFIAVLLICLIIFLPASIIIAVWQALINNLFVSGMLIVFSLTALSLIWTVGEKIDQWIFLFFNLYGKRPGWLDRIMFLLTQLGSGLAALFLSIIIYFSDRRILAYLVMLGTLSLWLVVELFKWITNRNRPYILVQNARVIGNPPIGRSFPSGHTSQSFFLATLFAQHFDTGLPLTVFLYLLAFTVAITRMYIGAHYPRDVLAGSILGSLWGVFIGVIGGYM